MNGKSILALDLGAKTGWALRLPTGELHSGTHEGKVTRFEGAGMRYLKFSAWLKEVFDSAGDVGLVAFEEVRNHAGATAAHAYGGYLAVLMGFCEVRGAPYVGVPVATIKKGISGKGNASKAEVMAAVRKLGYNPVDDNEADALAILEWAVEHHAVTESLKPGIISALAGTTSRGYEVPESSIPKGVQTGVTGQPPRPVRPRRTVPEQAAFSYGRARKAVP